MMFYRYGDEVLKLDPPPGHVCKSTMLFEQHHPGESVAGEQGQLDVAVLPKPRAFGFCHYAVCLASVHMCSGRVHRLHDASRRLFEQDVPPIAVECR